MIKNLTVPIGVALSLTVFAVSCKELSSGSDSGNRSARIAWDWTGIIGTGQSLAVGQNAARAESTNQPFGNLKLTTGNLPWPINPDNAELKLVPLVEPIGRCGTTGWPLNIAGETPHSAMANELTALVNAQFGRDFVSVLTEVGENGQGMQFIRKNPATRGGNELGFEGSMVET